MNQESQNWAAGNDGAEAENHNSEAGNDGSEAGSREQPAAPPDRAEAEAERPKGRHHSGHSAFRIRKVEPWPEPVDGNALLLALAELVRRFLVLPKWAAETLALWVLHTYAFQLRDVTTYLGIESPEKRCGKTTLLKVLRRLVNRPVVASNISSPAFFRVIAEAQPALLIDEADTLLYGNDELRGILNAGYVCFPPFFGPSVLESFHS